MNKPEWRSHLDGCHERWAQDLNRSKSAAPTLDEWRAEQCGACQYFIPLRGELGRDWGTCTNAASPCDRRVMFEHDGCARFRAGEGQGEYPFR